MSGSGAAENGFVQLGEDGAKEIVSLVDRVRLEPGVNLGDEGGNDSGEKAGL